MAKAIVAQDDQRGRGVGDGMDEGTELSCGRIEATGVREFLYGQRQVSMHRMGRVRIAVM